LDNLKKKISASPDTLGVYLMKDASGELLYVGKAKSLKKRLSTYLGKDLATKTVALMSHVADIDYELCPSESLALLREAALIRQYKPKYNVSLRDDKSFPLVKITNDEFPLVFITRKKESDAAFYLGPYTSGSLLREALKIIRRSFPFRSCRRLPEKACIYYRLRLCPAPCIGKISRSAYAKLMENISLILEGRADNLIKDLSRRMLVFSKEHNFEEAAQLRDQINALSSLGESKVTFNRNDELEDLKRFLRLERLPQRIEAFDVSNIFGKEATGSMVSFRRAEPDKDNYRKFRIKKVEAIDDYKMTAEVVSRRYRRLVEENLPLPDLVLIDGGSGHLSAAQKELDKCGLKIPLAAIAKEEENIYIKGRSAPLKLKSDTPALNLIRRIRDEAHRFAVSYHHVLRRKKIIGR
jgi:excinuclease ABC subunit C